MNSILLLLLLVVVVVVVCFVFRRLVVTHVSFGSVRFCIVVKSNRVVCKQQKRTRRRRKLGRRQAI